MQSSYGLALWALTDDQTNGMQSFCGLAVVGQMAHNVLLHMQHVDMSAKSYKL